MIDHDRIFKELIQTFFLEFIELFIPEVWQYVSKETLTFLPDAIFDFQSLDDVIHWLEINT